jgi:hypothetical protein
MRFTTLICYVPILHLRSQTKRNSRLENMLHKVVHQSPGSVSWNKVLKLRERRLKHVSNCVQRMCRDLNCLRFGPLMVFLQEGLII